MLGRVCILGSVNMDLVVRATSLPAPGETVAGGPFQTFSGGKGPNQAGEKRCQEPFRQVKTTGTLSSRVVEVERPVKSLDTVLKNFPSHRRPASFIARIGKPPVFLSC